MTFGSPNDASQSFAATSRSPIPNQFRLLSVAFKRRKLRWLQILPWGERLFFPILPNFISLRRIFEFNQLTWIPRASSGAELALSSNTRYNFILYLSSVHLILIKIPCFVNIFLVKKIKNSVLIGGFKAGKLIAQLKVTLISLYVSGQLLKEGKTYARREKTLHMVVD